MMTNSDIFFVANLQVYASPFTALYLDKGRGVLCLFVRISAPGTEFPKYIATEVTSNQVSRYMKRRLGLRTIFKNHSCYLANINGKGVELQETPSFKPTQEMKLSNMFDPEYCYDSLKLKMFLRRYDNNEYKV